MWAVYRPPEMVVLLPVDSYRCGQVDVCPGEWAAPSVASELCFSTQVGTELR